MAISDREWFVIANRLVPNPQFTGSYKYDNFQWTDERDYPTQEEIDAALATLDAAASAKAKEASAQKVYNDAMEAGYTDSNGITWYCNERAAMDLCMMVVLNTLDETEPVYVLSMSHGLRQMTYVEFKALAVTIGRYVYGLRHNLWGALLG